MQSDWCSWKTLQLSIHTCTNNLNCPTIHSRFHFNPGKSCLCEWGLSLTRMIDSSIYGARAFNGSGQIQGFQSQDVGLPFMPMYGHEGLIKHWISIHTRPCPLGWGHLSSSGHFTSWYYQNKSIITWCVKKKTPNLPQTRPSLWHGPICLCVEIFTILSSTSFLLYCWHLVFWFIFK